MKWYIFLQEPERALEIYEEARKRNPRDTQLAAKMGQALQKTHQYGKAINYYREAVRNEDHGSLRFDLAELLVNSDFLYFSSLGVTDETFPLARSLFSF